MATRKRKTTSRRARKTHARGPVVAAATLSDVDQQRQIMLLTLADGERALTDAEQALRARLAQPLAPRTEIQSAIADIGITLQAVRAKSAAVEADEEFDFPSEAKLARLREAMQRLEDGIARTDATMALIVATSEVVKAIRQS